MPKLSEIGSFWVTAPSNIALVKYMGKQSGGKNIPENASLSMTLLDLKTTQVWSPTFDGTFRLLAKDPRNLRLDEKATKKMLGHIQWVRARAMEVLAGRGVAVLENALLQGWEIETSNSFPAGAGIASSASSFAAATLGAFLSVAKDKADLSRRITEFLDFLTDASRQGSGSSCRSFSGPFVSWVPGIDSPEKVLPVKSRLPELVDLVCVVEENEKKVSSSVAHERVKTSPYWTKRVAAATDHFENAKRAIESGDFSELAKIAIEDSKQMHQLFETAQPSFSYKTKQTDEVLHFLKDEPVLLTLDAGPNVHVLVQKENSKALRNQIKKQFPDLKILEDEAGTGVVAGLCDFSSSMPAKVILAGEHSVLRGGKAVALPLRNYGMSFSFIRDDLGFRVIPDDLTLEVKKNLLGAGMDSQLMAKVSGCLRITSLIPQGAGLGSSAAWSVGLARFLKFCGATELSEFDQAKAFEDQIHGKSSGLDIRVVQQAKPIVFQKGDFKIITLADQSALQSTRWQPKLTVHDTGVTMATRDAILRVEALRSRDPALGHALDQKMAKAAEDAEKALRTADENALGQAMRLAMECFQGWGLVPDQGAKIIESLNAQGALACKMTGAGGGGMVLALWPGDQL